mgnify:CR=1 FL=1
MRSFRTLATYGFLGVMAFVSVFPFAWMIIGATNTSADIIKGRSWPGSALAENLSTLVTTNNVPEILYNSFKVAIIGTALTLLVASMAWKSSYSTASGAPEIIEVSCTSSVPLAATSS